MERILTKIFTKELDENLTLDVYTNLKGNKFYKRLTNGIDATEVTTEIQKEEADKYL
ncbi:hypothetical protein [Clostridium felsineum]|uniref:Uncharacterized protein n=1 Tax=Clostridium felsineum TaxID=36839 RepID=A0A1S8L4A9_9CLOT|nr:hypothetical protein [Clostridium felsineum]URZ06790.1 hypothetical protein CLROS_021230 [Clostridium felsineum]URZ11822.1 hypothetical protein CROST_025390 [Clostridium felsineum]